MVGGEDHRPLAGRAHDRYARGGTRRGRTAGTPRARPVDERVDAPLARRTWARERRVGCACRPSATRLCCGALQFRGCARRHTDLARCPRRRRGRGRLGRPAAARQAHLRRRLRRRRAARPGVTRGPAWSPIGLALHVGNGALSAPSTPRRPVAPAAAPGRAARSPGSPSTSPPGPATRSLTACIPRARELPRCGATGARSPRPPGGTCCSASCSASSSGGSTRPARAGPLDDARSPPTATAPSSTSSPREPVPERASSSPARRASPGATSRGVRRRPATRSSSSRARRACAVDLLDAAAARGRRGHRPDVVYHLAARAHVGPSWEEPGATLAETRR